LKILLVDDEADVLDSVKRGLERMGFEVDAFADPLEALRRFEKNAYEIALLDVKMPGMNGFQLYREILRRDDKVKVRFFTAHEEFRPEFRKAFPELDERGFIRKPTTLSRLAEILLGEFRLAPNPREGTADRSQSNSPQESW
jgi:DNA-binding response OmpR family regulator